MPFTFSHPAAILPFSYLSKKYVSFTGLIVGSMIPDFEYFANFSDKSLYSHTWSGLFWFDLPLALIVCFVFHNLVRNPLIENLPAPVLLRCTHCLNFNWNAWFRRKWLIICLCILLGAASHIVWDHLTHETTDHLQQTQYIQNKNIPRKDTVVYYGWWGLNSAVGAILLLFSFWKMPVQKRWKRHSSDTYWPLISICFVLIFIARLLFNDQLNIIDLVDTCISCFLLALILVPLIQKALKLK